MISAMNFKPFDRGAMKGFFDLRYHGLTIKGCRLMDGKNGLWVALPQQKEANDNGEAQYFDQMFLTKPEAEHIRRLVLADLQAQGHVDSPAPKGNQRSGKQRPPRRTPEGEDLSEYYTSPGTDDGIPY